tara:strand:+ start:1081 stop:1650 length:570 start_codon:yes stop_codon:yes gene_type:complete
MANTRSYPSATAKSSDLILGTSMPLPNTNDNPKTVNFSVGQINGLANSPDVVTAKVTVTDAQIQTLGTVPVEILPGVSGYIYEIIGATTRQINSGGNTDYYDWSGSGDGVLYGQGFSTTDHKIEVPNLQLPEGGSLNSPDVFVGTPIGGVFRTGSSLKLNTEKSVDPALVGTPNANWVIDVTYRLIQAE